MPRPQNRTNNPQQTGLALVRQIKKRKRLERQQQAATLNAAPVRPTRGGVSISVEALYKQAAAAQKAGRPDEAEALYTAAALAADADDRAANLKPQGELRL
jgi:hypothetical protein